MAKNLIIVDSCVLIKAFRKDTIAINDLKEIIDRTAYSVITQLELLIGANTQQKAALIVTGDKKVLEQAPKLGILAITLK